MTNQPLASIVLIVKNGEKYIQKCLEAVSEQSYSDFEVIIFDNNSDDRTKAIVKNNFSRFLLIESKKNYYVGGGFNRGFEKTKGKYIVALCVDVIIDKDFIKNAVSRMESDPKIAALQGKIMQYDYSKSLFTDIVDTVGFQIFRSRRIINIGHGEKDAGQFETPREIFSYEGACGIFRREALLDAKICGEIFDEDFLWYADDIDLGWRLTLLGWKNFYDPSVIAWHDRSTTKSLSRGFKDFIAQRKNIPAMKKRWDHAHQRFAMIKNEIASEFMGDFAFFIFRDIKLLAYFLLFERSSLAAFWDILRYMPRMIRKRKEIMVKKKISGKELKKWLA